MSWNATLVQLVKPLGEPNSRYVYEVVAPEVEGRSLAVGELIDATGGGTPALLAASDDQVSFYVVKESDEAEGDLPDIRRTDVGRPRGVRMTEVQGTALQFQPVLLPKTLAVEHERFPGRFECTTSDFVPEQLTSVRELSRSWL